MNITHKPLLEKRFNDNKGAIRNRKSKERQYNGRKKKVKRTSNDIQNTTQKTEDGATRTQLTKGITFVHCLTAIIKDCYYY